jgi:hypothetical protein
VKREKKRSGKEAKGHELLEEKDGRRKTGHRAASEMQLTDAEPAFPP